jgi:uncharacterized protein (TIGR01777 family)
VRIVIAGGSGSLGRPLAATLARQQHEVLVLTRRTAGLPAGYVSWTPDGTTGPWARALDGADAVVNLAGANIAARRWTATRKQELRDSRILAARSLVAALRAAPRPRVFVHGSGVGYYGPRGTEEIAEDHSPGGDFLAQLGIAWESEGTAARDTGARVVILRSAPVLAPEDGVLGRLLLPFRLGLGGPLGSGEQYLPWIHRRDWIDLVRWSLITTAAEGPINATAPQPVTNREFTRTLAKVLRRPHVLRVPAFALRLALGELADALLTGQRAVPKRALDMGFHFRYPSLEPALRDLLA